MNWLNILGSVSEEKGTCATYSILCMHLSHEAVYFPSLSRVKRTESLWCQSAASTWRKTLESSSPTRLWAYSTRTRQRTRSSSPSSGSLPTVSTHTYCCMKIRSSYMWTAINPAFVTLRWVLTIQSTLSNMDVLTKYYKHASALSHNSTAREPSKFRVKLNQQKPNS